MKRTSHLAACVAALTLSMPSLSLALPQSPWRIPNGAILGCQNCHPASEVTELNELGRLTQGIRHALIQPEDWWTIMYNVDSDGDGLSNGEELGDPCGTWRIGEPDPVVAEVSNPGDLRSWVEDPPDHACPPLSVAPSPPDPDDASTQRPLDSAELVCSAGGPGRGRGGAGWLAVALGLAGLLHLRSRRRR